MEEVVKSRRYDNSRRQARVRATRAEVAATAQRLFTERGYPATTIEAIAEASDTPIATVYRLFGSKRGILNLVVDIAFGGDDEHIAFADRPAVRSALAEPDPRRLLAAFAHLARELLGRSAPILHVLHSAADVDPEAAGMLAVTASQRFTGQSRIARTLAERQQLTVTEADATDIIYTLMSPEVYRILTIERHWSADRYETWLATSLQAQLLEGPHQPGPTGATRAS
jgi:AcrR family transcriptional regulator